MKSTATNGAQISNAVVKASRVVYRNKELRCNEYKKADAEPYSRKDNKRVEEKRALHGKGDCDIKMLPYFHVPLIAAGSIGTLRGPALVAAFITDPDNCVIFIRLRPIAADAP
jgi:hypothetical protein